MSVVLYPVPGTFLRGVPNAPIETDAATAARLLRTGGFTKDAPAGEKPAPVPYVADDQLDFYDSPVKHGEHYKRPPGSEPGQPEGPADAPGLSIPEE